MATEAILMNRLRLCYEQDLKKPPNSSWHVRLNSIWHTLSDDSLYTFPSPPKADLQTFLFLRVDFADMMKKHGTLFFQTVHSFAQGSTVTLLTGYIPVCRPCPKVDRMRNFMTACTGFCRAKLRSSASKKRSNATTNSRRPELIIIIFFIWTRIH